MFSFLNKSSKDDSEQTERPFLCDQVKLFGSCKGPCLERHTICKTMDKSCLNFPNKCFVSIQLIKVISASHFYGRILKYSTVKDPIKDEHWTTFDDSYERIKDELKIVGSSLNAKIVLKTPIVGELVMIETEQKDLFRAVILDVLHGWLSIKIKVKLIDLGYTKEINSNQVFVLPSHLKEFKPVAIDLIISSMKPVGKEDNTCFIWPLETTKVVSSLLQPFILTGLEIVCKVELILGNTLWVDYMLVKKCKKCSHFACTLYKNALMLPRELIERNLAKTDSQLIDKILYLDKDGHIFKDHISVEKNVNEPLITQKQNIQLFSSDEPKVETVNDVVPFQWAHLNKNSMHNVLVMYVENPKVILVRDLKFSDRIVALQKDIDEAVNKNIVEKLPCATVGTVCLAVSPEGDSYNRVLIKKINDRKADVLYVDYGESYSVGIMSLLTIPTSLITKLPFQAIECNLSGFKNILQTDINNKFCDNFMQLTSTVTYLKVLDSSSDTLLTEGNAYEIVLLSKDTNINITMADEFNVYVDDIKIKSIMSSNYKCDEYECDVNDDNEFVEEDFECQFNLLQSLLNNNENPEKELVGSNLPSTSQVTDKSLKVNVSQNISESLKLNHNTTKDKSTCMDEKQATPDLLKLNQNTTFNKSVETKNIQIKKKSNDEVKNKYCLDCNTNLVVPQCFWHQDKTNIHLNLNILSINNYNISSTEDTLTICVETDSTSYSFTIILYAFIINESLTSHKTYDGIRIKAQKLVQIKYRWPRLVKCPKKHSYLKYNIEHVTVRKDLNYFVCMVNKYKILGIGQPLATLNYDSDSDCDDNGNSDEFGIFED